MRGVVFIWPDLSVPVPEGRLVDPLAARLCASWQDADAEGLVEEVDLDGAAAAIAWGRQRSETVLIDLGGHTDAWLIGEADAHR